jgi:hypothetical protein
LIGLLGSAATAAEEDASHKATLGFDFRRSPVRFCFGSDRYGLTVRGADPVMVVPDQAAWIVVIPGPSPLARPRVPAALLIDATLVDSELQVKFGLSVMTCVVASEYVPVAVYCRRSPGLMAPLAGVTVIAVNVAAVTAMVADPDTPLKDAVMMMPVPGETPVANPSVPAALLTAAMAELLDPQLTCAELRSGVVPSE